MKWLRLYNETVDDPKVQRLAVHLYKTWVNLLCLASQYSGKLPSDDDLAFRLRMSVHDIAAQMDDLILAGLIDLDGKGGRSPHNWETRQYVSDTSTERVRKHRKRRKNLGRNADETFHETPPEQSRAEQIQNIKTHPLPPHPKRWIVRVRCGVKRSVNCGPRGRGTGTS